VEKAVYRENGCTAEFTAPCKLLGTALMLTLPLFNELGRQRKQCAVNVIFTGNILYRLVDLQYVLKNSIIIYVSYD